jgi:hypothetical protein
MEIKNLLGVCGLYCGSCSHYKVSQPEGETFLKIKRKEDPLFEKCYGCRSKKTTTYCSDCDIRSCAETKNILHCGLCKSYPCEKIKEFQMDGKAHHVVVLDNLEHLKTTTPEKWLIEQEEIWKCKCGAKYSWYEATCLKCGSRLPSYSK